MQLSVTAGPHTNEVIPINAANNAASLVEQRGLNLASGDNTLSIPVVNGVTFTRLTLIPPAGNTQLIKLKSVGGDSGVQLHKTDPTSLGIDSTLASVVLNAAGIVNDFLVIWS